MLGSGAGEAVTLHIYKEQPSTNKILKNGCSAQRYLSSTGSKGYSRRV